MLSTKSELDLRAASVSERICAIFPGALGDFICFLATLRTLHRIAPVDLYARSEYRELVPDGIAVRSLESPEITALFRQEAATPQVERWPRYHAVYSWHGSGNAQFVRNLHGMTGGRAQCFPFRPVLPSCHQEDYYLECIGAKQERPGLPLIPLRDETIRWRDSFWVERGLERHPVLTLAPGSGAREKNWPAQCFSKVAAWWRLATGGKILLLIGPVESERGGLNSLLADAIQTGPLSLDKVAAVLERSTLYLGNDSGVSHLAGAIGARTVVLFGPSDPSQWEPRGSKVVVLRRGLACSPCSDRVMKQCPHIACLRDFPPHEIIAAVAQLPEVVTLTR